MTPTGLLDGALLSISLLVAVPPLVLFVQLVAAAALGRSARQAFVLPPASDRTLPLAVLMPAHDEEAGIAASIRAVRDQTAAHDRVLVVADNCTDATAAVARAAGAEVIERHDLQRRGKGYALDFGVRWLERDPPAVVVIVDADCIVASGALSRLASRCLASGRPVQALYLMRAPANAGLGMRIAEFAWIVRNKLRPMGNTAFGWPCQLMGTGMAFPWAMIQRAPLATGHLVEDMQLGLDLAAAGTPPMFCAEALVSSSFPTDSEGVKSQRTRWEHGHLSVILGAGPRMLWNALRQRDPGLLAMALDLVVPPLASLVLMLVCMIVVDAAWWAFGGGVSPLAAAVGAMGLLTAGVVIAWMQEGRRIVSAAELLGLPIYVAAKIPVYVRLFTKRQVEWVRTRRDDGRP